MPTDLSRGKHEILEDILFKYVSRVCDGKEVNSPAEIEILPEILKILIKYF